MATFVMTTKLSHEALASPDAFDELSAVVNARVRQECPSVQWWRSFVLLGPVDYLDIFSAPDIETATKVAALIRSFGHATTQIWPAVEAEAFKEIVRGIASPRREAASGSRPPSRRG